MKNDYRNSIMGNFDPIQLHNKFYRYGYDAGMTGQLYDPVVTWSEADKAMYRQGFDDARR